MTDEQLADLRARISDDITAHEITGNGKMKRVQNMRDALVVLDEAVRLRAALLFIETAEIGVTWGVDAGDAKDRRIAELGALLKLVKEHARTALGGAHD